MAPHAEAERGPGPIFSGQALVSARGHPVRTRLNQIRCSQQLVVNSAGPRLSFRLMAVDGTANAVVSSRKAISIDPLIPVGHFWLPWGCPQFAFFASDKGLPKAGANRYKQQQCNMYFNMLNITRNALSL